MKHLVPALAVLLCVTLSCTFFKDRLANGEKPADNFRKIAKLPPLDPNAPLPSPGALAIRELAKVDPSVAIFADEIESAERSAIKKILSANAPAKDVDTKAEKASIVPSKQDAALMSARPTLGPAPAMLMFQAGSIPLPGIGDGVFVGIFTGGLKSMLADVEPGNFHRSDSKTEKDGDTTTKMDFDLGGSEDGSTFLGFGLESESVKNGAKVNTEMRGKIEGNDCPTVDGQVQISIKVRLSARSAGAGYTQDLTIFIRMLVDDNASVAATTIDTTQATSRGKNGQEVYVETGETIKYNGGKFDTAVRSNERVIQKTDNATQADADEFGTSGISAAYGAAIAAMSTAERTWKDGKCIKIEARAPGTVEPSSGVEVPVKVIHKKDGSEVAAKLDVNLVGEKSIDPTLIPKTPGTLMYIAPGETGKSATIKLTATSRRGIAKLDLPASTGTNAYRISGGLDDWETDTIVCDITKPFTLTGGGFTMKLSGGISGTYEYSGPFNAKGTGTYEMRFPYGAGKNGEMVGQGGGSIKGDKTYEGSGVERYTLMTVDGPCVDGPAN